MWFIILATRMDFMETFCAKESTWCWDRIWPPGDARQKVRKSQKQLGFIYYLIRYFTLAEQLTDRRTDIDVRCLALLAWLKSGLSLPISKKTGDQSVLFDHSSRVEWQKKSPECNNANVHWWWGINANMYNYFRAWLNCSLAPWLNELVTPVLYDLNLSLLFFFIISFFILR